jgi:hypothetical protein
LVGQSTAIPFVGAEKKELFTKLYPRIDLQVIS